MASLKQRSSKKLGLEGGEPLGGFDQPEVAAHRLKD